MERVVRQCSIDEVENSQEFGRISLIALLFSSEADSHAR
jgi:hypothetical protein